MSDKYREAMDKLVISDELREKILKNTSEQKKKSKPIRVFYVKRSIGYAACFMLCMGAVLANKGYIRNKNIPMDEIISTQTPIVVSQEKGGVSATAVPADKNGVSTVEKTDINKTAEKKASTKKESKTTSEEKTGEKKYNGSEIKYQRSDKTQNVISKKRNVKKSQEIKGSSNFVKSEDVQAHGGSEQAVTAEENIALQSNDMPSVARSVQRRVNNDNAVATMSLNPFDGIREAVGYDFKIPAYIPNEYVMDNVSVENETTVQISYKSDKDSLVYKTDKDSEKLTNTSKSDKDTQKSDIVTKTETINNSNVVVSEKDDVYYDAKWNDENSYSISSEEGIQKDEMISIIENVDYPEEEVFEPVLQEESDLSAEELVSNEK